MNPGFDPTLDIQLELERSLTIAHSLSERLKITDLSDREIQWTESELKKSIRAIYWAVDDYSHTLSVLALDPSSLLLTAEEREIRDQFIRSALEFADHIRSHTLRIPSRPVDCVKVLTVGTTMTGAGSYKYSLLNNEDENAREPSSSYGLDGSNRFEDILLKQERIIREQDDDLELVGKSVSTLKNMSYKIGDELDQHSIMLEDLSHDMDRVDTKLDGVMKKIAKLAHLDDDQRQCKAIVVLSIILFFLVFMLIVL